MMHFENWKTTQEIFLRKFDHNRLGDYIVKLTPEIIATQALKPDERQYVVDE